MSTATETDPRSDSQNARPGRPGSRSFAICESDNLLSKQTGVGLTLDAVISDELADYHRGQAAWLDDGKAADEIDYAANNPDLAIWEDNRCLAVIKVDPEGGDPRVYRLDQPAQWTTPDPGPRPRFRTLTAHTATSNPQDCEPARFAEHGMDLAHVIRWHNNAMYQTVKDMTQAERREYIESHPDIVVVEEGRAVAVLRAGEDGLFSAVGGTGGFGGK